MNKIDWYKTGTGCAGAVIAGFLLTALGSLSVILVTMALLMVRKVVNGG